PVAAQSGVVASAAGRNHTVALKNDGSVVTWGSNGETDVPISAQSGVTAIASGQYHTVALKSDGSVVAWGKNSDGQTTVPVAAQSGVTEIAAGGYQTVALLGTAPPYLIPTVTDTNLTLSWQSAIAQGFALHGNADVGLSNSWAVVGPSAVSNLGYYSVTLPLTGTNQFFRLKKP
ncbi:MAG: hypothetical protein HZA89_14305, partial [Verrucomicrobia bacterium]|nr:hypothetical protein [Verrucomicrobiota bacterium]